MRCMHYILITPLLDYHEQGFTISNLEFSKIINNSCLKIASTYEILKLHNFEWIQSF